MKINCINLGDLKRIVFLYKGDICYMYMFFLYILSYYCLIGVYIYV